jgi:hypothetical protein
VNKIKAGFFSFTEVPDRTEHRSYNEWHQLDHMPEQFTLPGIAFGQRWVSTPPCTAARAVSGSLLAPVHYVTLYLMTEPLEQTLAEFRDLAAQLRAADRFHPGRTAHLSGEFDLQTTAVAPRVLVSAEAVPYRPNRGVYVIVEERVDPAGPWPVDDTLSELVEVDGVTGVWSFAAADGERITACFLDGEPVDVAVTMRGVLAGRWDDDRHRPLLAGPFEAITPRRWDWFD